MSADELPRRVHPPAALEAVAEAADAAFAEGIPVVAQAQASMANAAYPLPARRRADQSDRRVEGCHRSRREGRCGNRLTIL